MQEGQGRERGTAYLETEQSKAKRCSPNSMLEPPLRNKSKLKECGRGKGEEGRNERGKKHRADYINRGGRAQSRQKKGTNTLRTIRIKVHVFGFERIFPARGDTRTINIIKHISREM